MCLRVYQLCISPLLGTHCRFVPSCSCYAHQALEKHGTLRGSLLAAKRLLRCNPFFASAYDPVPDNHSQK
ncbi:MAG: membrane protein insertion efficiency factor YidD [Alphaproteobacteria bacterium]